MSNWNGTAYYLTEAEVESGFNAICTTEIVQTRREHLARLSLETRIETWNSLDVNAVAAVMMMMIGLMWVTPKNEKELRLGTHPTCLERLDNMLLTFDAMLSVSHITKKQLLELVP